MKRLLKTIALMTLMIAVVMPFAFAGGVPSLVRASGRPVHDITAVVRTQSGDKLGTLSHANPYIFIDTPSVALEITFESAAATGIWALLSGFNPEWMDGFRYEEGEYAVLYTNALKVGSYAFTIAVGGPSTVAGFVIHVREPMQAPTGVTMQNPAHTTWAIPQSNVVIPFVASFDEGAYEFVWIYNFVDAEGVVVSAPTNWEFNTVTGVLTGGFLTVGTVRIRVDAINYAGQAVSNIFEINGVIAEVAPTTITAVGTMEAAVVGTAFSHVFGANGTPREHTNWTWTFASDDAELSGFTIIASTTNPGQATLNGTSTVAGTFTFTLTANNGIGETNETFTIVVEVAPTTITPVSTIQTGIVGATFSHVFTANGSVRSYTNWTWTVTSDTAWLDEFTITRSEANPGEATLTGTLVGEGVFSFTLTANNGHGTATQTFSIGVTEQMQAPTTIIATQVTPDGGALAVSQAVNRIGQGQNVRIEFATDGEGYPIWSHKEGILPTGLSFTREYVNEIGYIGVLQGALSENLFGSFMFRINVAIGGNVHSESFIINVVRFANVPESIEASTINLNAVHASPLSSRLADEVRAAGNIDIEAIADEEFVIYYSNDGGQTWIPAAEVNLLPGEWIARVSFDGNDNYMDFITYANFSVISGQSSDTTMMIVAIAASIVTLLLIGAFITWIVLKNRRAV